MPAQRFRLSWWVAGRGHYTVDVVSAVLICVVVDQNLDALWPSAALLAADGGKRKPE